MSLLQKINAVWQKIGVVQRAMLIAIVMACAIIGGLLTHWATRADMQLLYGNLEQEAAGNIVDKISELGIEYELRGGGTSIWVPKENVYQLRLNMAKEGLLGGGNKGYELFDNQGIGVSPVVQQLNLTRALQDELSKTIRMIDGIISARVHIVRPEETLFSGSDQTATASVSIQMKPGWTIGQGSVVAITNIVANATDGLQPENVTVIDSKGNMLTSKSSNNALVGGANTFMDYKSRVEQEMAAKVQEMLDMVLGSGRSTVKISAVVDMENIETITTTYQEGMPLEETVNTTSKETPASVDSEGKQISAGTTETTDISENKYMIPETITKTSDVPGKIVSVSVAAFVDLQIEKLKPKAEGADETAPDEFETIEIMTVSDVEEIIKSAIGPKLLVDEEGKEIAGAITVKDIRFNKPAVAAVVDEGPFSYEKVAGYIAIIKNSSVGILAVCFLIVLKILTGGKKKVAAAEGAEGAEAAAAMSGLSLGMLPAGGMSDDPIVAFRQHIVGALKENPDQVRQLFASWLSEEG